MLEKEIYVDKIHKRKTQTMRNETKREHTVSRFTLFLVPTGLCSWLLLISFSAMENIDKSLSAALKKINKGEFLITLLWSSAIIGGYVIGVYRYCVHPALDFIVPMLYR